MAVLSNKIRAILTGLGIIFGVAAVIAMLSIGAGAQQEIIEQIKLVGVNNIIVSPVVEQFEEDVQEEDGDSEGAEEVKKISYSKGLTVLDLKSIREFVPNIERISPEIIIESTLLNNGLRKSAKLVGVNNDYFSLFNYELYKGNTFSQDQLLKGLPVCIIGSSVNARFFMGEEALGKHIKVGNQWLKVIGVLKERSFSTSKTKIGNLGIRDFNMDVYIPVQTMLMRYKNRALVNDALIQMARYNEDENKNVNHNQLDKIIVQAKNTESLLGVRDVISRMLERRHYSTIDFEITIPEMLLKQQEKTKSIFNFVLGAIAGISLLVGGIGIMNIMLASVMERIKEIGLRLSVGAKKRDIVTQFLLEALLISVSGGILGVVLGIVMASMVSELADIPTVISFGAIALAFTVAAAVGIVFGITPARRAAEQNPIESLRYE